MNDQTRYQETDVVKYDPELWNTTEKWATQLLPTLEADYKGDLKTVVTDFLNQHQDSLDLPGLAAIRNEILDIEDPIQAKQSLEALMEKSRELITTMQAVDSTK